MFSSRDALWRKDSVVEATNDDETELESFDRRNICNHHTIPLFFEKVVASQYVSLNTTRLLRENRFNRNKTGVCRSDANCEWHMSTTKPLLGVMPSCPYR